MEDQQGMIEDILAVAKGMKDLQQMVVQQTPEPETYFEMKASHAGEGYQHRSLI